MRKRKNEEKAEFMPDMIIRPIPPEVRHLVARTRRNDTPDNILRNSLKEAFDVDPDDNARYRRFISSLMTNLSLLVSNDKSTEMFDQDFDTFFTMVVRSINSCGEMMELLEQHGIEYRPKWKNEDDEGKD